MRLWRTRRRLSQLELSLRADTSTRHLSFVETGRSQPSREMVLRLCDVLDVPLRERNHVLLAGGYAPVFAERSLGETSMGPARDAVRRILTGHDPYPAIVVDRNWTLLDANASASVLLQGVDADLLEGEVNVLRVSLHPRGLAPNIVNLPEWRSHLLHRLRHQADWSGDPQTVALHAELLDYPGGEALPTSGDAPWIAVPLRLRFGDTELSFITTVATFGTPLDVTISELAIESFFPADDATARLLPQLV
ncbi:helix-turn-helix transcriptional regulator [Spiractinospora alimapuensis]|nr:helix-turn-helix transcriptional regulator [Spiractinospora alimapuensis]